MGEGVNRPMAFYSIYYRGETTARLDEPAPSMQQ
jgi:hypothetical protein